MTRHVLVLCLGLLLACGNSHDSADFDVCTVSSECLVVPASCCGSCGAATRADGVAIQRDSLRDHQADVCGDDLACPACFMEQDPNLIATCRVGRCQLVDVLADALSECAVDADCRLRTRDCCECGGDTSSAGLIAIRVDGQSDYMNLVCDDGAMAGCPECAPVFPADTVAACSAGRCEVIRTR